MKLINTAAFLLVLFAVTSCIKEDHGTINRTLNSEERKNWMSKVDYRAMLNEISIPGTHNSGSKEGMPGTSRCQNYTIEDQLNDGIRFLDIRVKPYERSSDRLQIMHGTDNLNISFGTVLTWCSSFLKANPSETIIMLVNHYEDEKGMCIVEPEFKKYLDDPEFKNLFFSDSFIPNLGLVRGKIVLFRRFNSQQRRSMGIDLQDIWENNKTFRATTIYGAEIFQIEDEYDEHNTKDKLTSVTNNLKAASKETEPVFYITYNSISFDMIPPRSPYNYACGGDSVRPAMNPAVSSFLNDNPGMRHWGTIMLDFYCDRLYTIIPDYTLVDRIISSNFN